MPSPIAEPEETEHTLSGILRAVDLDKDDIDVAVDGNPNILLD